MSQIYEGQDLVCGLHGSFLSFMSNQNLIFMFDFEKLEVFQKAKMLNHEVSKYLRATKVDHHITDQLKRASLSVLLNIAEGAGKETKPSQRNFYSIAKGSTYECAAIFVFLDGEHQIAKGNFKTVYRLCLEISRMLFGLIKHLN